MTDTTETPAPRPVGRPRNADRLAQHTPQHTSAEREAAHEEAHDKPRARTRSRSRRDSVVDNPFHIPPEIIPPDQSWEWKRYSNVGEENPFYLAQMRQQGWEPVEPRALGDLLPANYTMPNVIREGQILMERPLSLTLEAIEERKFMAKRQVAEAEERLGHAPKELGVQTGTRDLSEVRPRLHKEWNRPVPIED
jgi:hypothetical protein